MAMVLLASACTARPAEEQPPEVADAQMAAGGSAVFPGVAGPGPEPEREPEPEPKPEPEVVPGPMNVTPRIVVTALDAELDVYTAMDCPFGVAAEGFPAISADGATVVRHRIEASSGSEGEDDQFSVDWVDITGGTGSAVDEVDEVYDAWKITQAIEDDPEACATFHREIRRKAKAVNTRLAAQTWRPMPRLDVYVPDVNGEYDAGTWAEPSTVDAKTRPVEVVWQRGRIIARVRRVKVLFDESAPWFNEGGREPTDDGAWDPESYNPCEYEPVLSTVRGDAATGLLMITYDHDRPETSCMCAGFEYVEYMTVGPEFFAQIERRPRVAA